MNLLRIWSLQAAHFWLKIDHIILVLYNYYLHKRMRKAQPLAICALTVNWFTSRISYFHSCTLDLVSRLLELYSALIAQWVHRQGWNLLRLDLRTSHNYILHRMIYRMIQERDYIWCWYSESVGRHGHCGPKARAEMVQESAWESLKLTPNWRLQVWVCVSL